MQAFRPHSTSTTIIDFKPDQFIAEPLPPSPEKPWDINYILADLDGTLVNTYIAFHAAELLATYFHDVWLNSDKDRAQIIEDLALYIKKYAAVEQLLHEPGATLFRIAKFYAWHERGVLLAALEEEKYKQFSDALAECFNLFPGVKEFLIAAKTAGTAVSIYTNTNPQNTIRRLIKAGITPDLIQDIWTRTKNKNEIIGVFDWPMNEREASYVKKLRPYTKGKPNPEPILKIREWYNLKPENILLIGEGIGDLGSALYDPESLNEHSRFYCRFAFQQAGAAATEPHAQFNQVIRENHPLGLNSFAAKYPAAPTHPGVLVLENGFESLSALIESRAIQLNGTPEPDLSFVSTEEAGRPKQPKRNLAQILGTLPLPTFGSGAAEA